MDRKNISYALVVVVLLVLAFGVGRLSAASGTLDSPGPPDDPTSASYTLEDIYQRLDTGAAGSPSTFSEPTSGPTAGTGHTLNDIMAIAPAVDEPGGAAGTDVLAGTTLWGLTSGQWGPVTGTMPDNGTVVITPTTVSQTIAAGYHDGLGYVEGDVDLVSGNIRAGTSIFGVGGSGYVVNTRLDDIWTRAAAYHICIGRRAWVNGTLLQGRNTCGDCCGAIYCGICSACSATEYFDDRDQGCHPKRVDGAFCVYGCECLSGYCHIGGGFMGHCD